jgi:hypothetical protein
VSAFRQTVITSFIDELKCALELNGSGWIAELIFTAGTRSPRLALRKHSWPRGWAVCLCPERAPFRNFVIGFRCPSQKRHLREENLDPHTPLAAPQDSMSIRRALTKPLGAIGDRVRIRPRWAACCHLPSKPPLRHWNEADAVLLLGGLESMPDGSPAVGSFVYWFWDLAHAAEASVDAALSRTAHAGSC